MIKIESIIKLILPLLFLIACANEKKEVEIENEPEYIPDMQYGFDFNKFEIYKGKVENNWTLSHLFAPYNIDQASINEVALLAQDTGLKYISRGNEYIMLCKQDNDTIKDLQYCIYVKNAIDYYVFDFTDSLNVYKKQHSVDTIEKAVSLQINKGSNLSLALKRVIKGNNLHFDLIEEIAKIYSWKIDFFRLMPGDKFKVIYEEKRVDTVPVGIGKIKAILFNHRNHDLYAFWYVHDSTQGYYDEEGKGMRSMFLQAPLKYTRVSSKYTARRFHPVQKRWKAHLGTDYAAPRGTPIWATASGTVTKATRGGGNGIYVKLRHNKTYETQYLHMSKIAEGISPGVFVNQGDVIGYVGSTGLATGPHVCYRFWKNGKQIDHTQEVFESTEPLDSLTMPNYIKFMDSLKVGLDRIKFPEEIINEKDSIQQDSIIDISSEG